MTQPVADSPSPDLTDFLREWSSGDQEAAEKFLPLLYAELRQMARNQLRQEIPHHTLQPTALVHEAYLRVLGQRRIHWHNRCHFLGVAGGMMRRVLVDHARRKRRKKRGGGQPLLTIEPWDEIPVLKALPLLELEDALRDLEKFDPRMATIVELHFFAGLSVEETATVLRCSSATISRQWRLARAWLYRELGARDRNES